jgi:hypothetical protein
MEQDNDLSAQVRRIIKRRQLQSGFMMVFIGLLGILSLVSFDPYVAVLAAFPFTLEAWLYSVNRANANHLKLSYRGVNNFYSFAYKVFSLNWFSGSAGDLAQVASSKSPVDLALSGVDASMGAKMYKNNDGNVVDEYLMRQDASVYKKSDQPVVVHVNSAAILIMGALVPTLLIFLLVGAYGAGFGFASSDTALIGSLLGFGYIIAPLIMVAPFLAVVAVLSWGLSKLLSQWGIGQDYYSAYVILLGSATIDALLLIINFKSIVLTEALSAAGGITIAFIILWLDNFPYGPTKKRLQYVLVIALVVSAYVTGQAFLRTSS